MKSQLPERVLDTIREHGLFRAGDTVVVGFSGGADSSALLEILSGRGFRLVAAHLNHCLRGDDSDADEEFCRTRAADYGIPFRAARIDVARYARREGLNLEDAGRRARRNFLEEIRQSCGAAVVALAHHADDQAETVLMRLLRGAGTTGLGGMALRSGTSVRPLLEVSRREIVDFLERFRIPHREDASNSDTRFLRNRIRHQLLPLLETYNPAVRTALATTALLCADDEKCLEELSARTECVLQPGKDAVSFVIEPFLTAPPALRRRLLRTGISLLKGDLAEIGFRHIRALEQLAVSSRPNSRIALPGGLGGRRCYGMLVIERIAPQDIATEVLIHGPGEYRLPLGGTLTVSLSGSFDEAPIDGAASIVADPREHPFPWVVRTFRNGDRIAPFGMRGSKKVKDLFIDAKVPAPERRRIPLVISAGKLIWVCGLRSSCCGWGGASFTDGSLRAVYTPS